MEEQIQEQEPPKDLNNITYSEILQQNKKYLDIKLYETSDFLFKTYKGNHQRERIIELMTKYLSEPYPVYTYMYFLDLFPDCTILCYDKNKKTENNELFICGAVVGNINRKPNKIQGYIAMLAVENEYRKKGLGKKMVELLIDIFKKSYKVNEISIDTEVDNYAALGLYESFGFVRTKMYINYYFNANNAYKLKLFNYNIDSEEANE
jgi:peptide alpha-N-acetyltransferase